MFCPRCGRPVSDTANFCGGCGLPRAEIEKYFREKATQTPAVPQENINTDDINSTIEKLENDLSGVNPVTDYTTEVAEDTNTISTADDVILQSTETEEQPQSETSFYGQSQYSANAPEYPEYSYSSAEIPQSYEHGQEDTTLSTVDYIWMMLISSIPVVGIIYLIWLGFIQKDNPNKSAYAKASLIISVFAILLAVVFAMGIVLTQVSAFF